MMLLLVGDVRPQRFDMGLGWPENAPSPFCQWKSSKVRTLLVFTHFDDSRLSSLDQIGDGDDTAESAKDMNVIGDTADAEDRTIKGVTQCRRGNGAFRREWRELVGMHEHILVEKTMCK